MSLPDHVLSVVPVASQFSGSRALPVTGLVDYEVGGVALHNPSKGLLYQTWRARVLGQDILLGAPNTPEFVVYAGSATITEVSLAFRSEEHTSELQSRENLVCRLLLEKK